jgi:hypothetical protein
MRASLAASIYRAERVTPAIECSVTETPFAS